MTKKTMTLACAGLLACVASAELTEKPWMDATLAPDARARLLVKEMTLEEKVGETILVGAYPKVLEHNKMLGATLTGGLETLLALQQERMKTSRLGIPLIFHDDVIHGWQTLAPVPIATSCSWDEEAVEKAEALAAREAAASGMNLTYAPMVDISEDVRWGRVMETHGEDPYLSGRIAAARVRGFQGRDPDKDLLRDDKIASCAKHFLGYAAVQGGRDYVPRDFSLRDVYETYIVPYRWAVKAGVSAFMCAYLQFNGEFVTFSPAIRDLLRKELGFDGLYMTDWETMTRAIELGVSADRVESATRALVDGGLDMDMASRAYTNLVTLVRAGKVPEKLVDEAAVRCLALKFKCGLFEDPYRHLDPKRRDAVVFSEQSKKEACEIAEKSIILLENDGTLPVAIDRNDKKNTRKIGVVGPFAQNCIDPMGQWKCRGEETNTVTLLAGLQEVFGKRNVVWHTDPSHRGRNNMFEQLSVADVIVVAIGESRWESGEYFNSARLSLPQEQIQLIRDFKAIGKKVVAVVYAGRPVVMREIADAADAVLYAWLPGTMGGRAIARILAGEVNPQAKTCQTFYWDAGQVGNTYREKRTWDATGYCDLPHRDAKRHPANPVQYPFGFGRSYTTYAYGRPRVDRDTFKAGETFRLTVGVTNTGARAGREIVQVYKRDAVSSVHPRVRELCEFACVDLKPGEAKDVTFEMKADDFAIWDRNFKRTLEPGDFTLFVGPDSTTTNQVVVHAVAK